MQVSWLVDWGGIVRIVLYCSYNTIFIVYCIVRTLLLLLILLLLTRLMFVGLMGAATSKGVSIPIDSSLPGQVLWVERRVGDGGCCVRWSEWCGCRRQYHGDC